MRQLQVNKFMMAYTPCVRLAHKTYPKEYVWPIENIMSVLENMEKAFLQGTYSHEGHAIKMTCKQLGIKHSRKAMEEFFNV